MSSTKELRDYVLEELRCLSDIVCKPMMGEFLLYYKGVLFGGIYDDRLLIKMTKSNAKYDMQTVIPYKNAKPMYKVAELDDTEYLRELIETTCNDLKVNKN